MINLFCNQVQEFASVVSVARSSGIPGNYPGSFSLFVAEGNEKADPFDWRVARVDAQYFDVFKIPFREGRNFIAGSETDRQTGAIINEAALRAMGLKSAIGKKLLFPDGEGFLEIVGVTQDFNYGSVAQAVEPVVHVYRGEEAYTNYPYVSILLQPGSGNRIEEIGAAWQKQNPDRQFEYFFPSDRFNDLYNTDVVGWPEPDTRDARGVGRSAPPLPRPTPRGGVARLVEVVPTVAARPRPSRARARILRR